MSKVEQIFFLSIENYKITELNLKSAINLVLLIFTLKNLN